MGVAPAPAASQPTGLELALAILLASWARRRWRRCGRRKPVDRQGESNPSFASLPIACNKASGGLMRCR